ncbi:MAG TPA: serine/threonine-protein kinase [Kofleriaceae bacterium]|nr:serine/threonine-protein kinase [Kofleriaceae bacterium]
MAGSDDKLTVALDETLTDVDRSRTVQVRPRTLGLPTIDPSLYDLGEEIAQGGMGRIRAARDLRLGRDVAIKEILEPRGSLATRFEREAMLTARLQHPSIVAVYEAGRWPTGEPFYAMRLVPGTSLKKAITQRASGDERLALLPNVIAIADAMAYAHDQRIIHRDLKPANVLVGDFGETVVIDWGLAKDLDASDGHSDEEAMRASSGELTVAGSIVGTPNYMPPEQAAGDPVDERADVYAIGALLYHVLAGVPPYVGDNAKEILEKVAKEPPPPITTLQKGIAPDLVAIVERAMSREVARRYPSARELAEDLKRFQTGQLVGSHRYSRRELISRFVRRYRTPLAITSVAAIIVAAIGVLAVQRIRHERDQSVLESHRADRERDTAERERAKAAERADSLTIEQAASSLERDPRSALQLLQGLSSGSSQWTAARLLAADAASRGIARPLYRGDVQTLAVSPDGKQLAIADQANALLLVDLATGHTKQIGSHRDVIEKLTFAKNGRALLSRSRDHDVTVWDLASSRVTTLPHDSPVGGAHISEDGTYVITIEFSKRARLWEVASAAAKVDVQTKEGMVFLPSDAGVRALYETDAGFAVVNAATGGVEQVFRNKSKLLDNVSGVSWSTNRLQLAFAKHDGVVGIYDIASGTERILGKHGAGPVYSPSYLPGDSEIVTVADGELRVWPVAGGKPRVIGTQPEREAFSFLTVSPTGHHVIVTSGVPRLWNLDTGASALLVGPLGGLRSMQFTPDGTHVLGLAADGVWSWPTQRSDESVERRPEPVRGLAFAGTSLLMTDAAGIELGTTKLPFKRGIVGRAALAPDGKRIALLGKDGHVHVIDVARQSDEVLEGTLETLRREFPADPKAQTDKKSDVINVRRYTRWTRDRGGWFDPVVFSPNGSAIAAAGTSGGRILLYKAGSPTPITIELGTTDVEQLLFAPDGKTLFVAASDSNVHVISATGADRSTLKHSEIVEAMTLSADGKTLYTACVDRTIRSWFVATGTQRVIGKHPDIATALALTPDGKHLVSAGHRKQIELWDLATGDSVPLDGLAADPLVIAVSGDGGRLVAGDTQGTVRVWDLASHRGRTLRSRGDAVGALAISPDGTRVVAADDHGQLIRFDDTVPATEPLLRQWIADALR